MNWTIEKGRDCHAQTIAQFQLDMALESEGTVLDGSLILKGVETCMADPHKGTYYVVKAEDGTVAGSLLITKEWSDWKNCWYWWIQSVYVRPEYRRQGAYAALYERMKEEAKADGSPCLRLYVDRGNVRAQKCYQGLGMQECHYLMYEETFND